MPPNAHESASPGSAGQRPQLAADVSAEEFSRWYWLKDELVVFARALGIRASGGKEVLAARIAAKLAGREFVEPATARTSGSKQLAGQLTGSTLIPVGQRSSQVVRAWLTEQVGDGFHFDAEMRAFFTDSDGTRTLDDAIAHWYATRDQAPREIDKQFEFNRFTRAWHARYPEGSRADLLAAWSEYRSRPIDERGRV